MFLKKLSFLAIGLLSVALFISVSSAVSKSGFTLTQIGDSDTSSAYKVTTSPKIVLELKTPDAKAELGISLLKRALISYKLQTRGDTWINGRSVITSVYPDYEDGSYKTTVVMNDTMDNKTVSGQYYITNK